MAEKIARILDSEARPNSLSAILESINAINKRLDKIEEKLEPVASIHPSSPIHHPSTERFSIAEAMADEIFSGIPKEKACTFEPDGKPCDHCSMCSSRGF
ncbi:MAG TPA: hypothetical protein VL325_02485 [Pyrinomonadaceae bacterium]|nr:hypothetical protein [Pyrinomonadaceae bacterium]